MQDVRLRGLVALALLLPVSAGAEEVTREFSHRFEAAGARLLHVEHGDGDLVLVPGDGDAVMVSVVYRVQVQRMGWGSPPDLDVQFTEKDGVLSVVGKEKGSVNVGVLIESEQEYRYTIHAPATLALESEGDDGDVRISGWRAPLTCRVEDGDLLLSDCRTGPFRIHVSDGDLGVEGIEGTIEFTGEDGRVEVADANLTRGSFELDDGDLLLEGVCTNLAATLEDGTLHLERARIETGVLRVEDGNVRAQLLAVPALDLEVRTEDGSIELLLPPDLSATYEIQSEEGRIELELPGGENARRNGNTVIGTLGDGTGRLRIVAAEGDVSLRLGTAP
jgi:hypothetical protein